MVSNGIRRRPVVFGALAAASFGAGSQSSAQTQAKKLPVAKILAGFPAGGNVDVVSRRLAEFLRGVVADSVVVENRPGAGGRIAIDALRNGASDGSQWLITPGSMVVIYPHVYKKLSYNVQKDLLPVSQVCNVPLAFAVGPAVPASVKDVPSFVAWARANPTQANIGSPAAGAVTHFMTYLFEKASQTKLQHIAFRGSAPAIQDLLGGQIPGVLSPVGDMLQHVAGGKLRILATTSRKRTVFTPDVPTFVEQGYSQVVGSEWFAMFAPAGTPPMLVDRMGTAVRAALRTAAVQESFSKLGYEPLDVNADGLGRQVRNESSGWLQVAQVFGFRLED